MKYALDTFNLRWLLNDFSLAVDKEGLIRIPHSYWKDLKRFNCKFANVDQDSITFISGDDDCITLDSNDCDDFILFAKTWFQTHLSEMKQVITDPDDHSLYVTSSKTCPDSFDLCNISIPTTNKIYPYMNYDSAIKYSTESVISDSKSVVNTTEDIIKNYIKKDKNTIQERKETDTVNMFSKINFDFGPANPENIKLSPFGIAIKTPNRSWHTYDATNQKIVDVSNFNFSFGSISMFYKVPVAPDAVTAGDIILHNDRPVFVIGFSDEKNKAAGITCIDTDSNEQKTILPVCNIFNFNFITKIVSLFNMTGGVDNIFGTPTADQPFGNIFGMMMMSEMFKDDGKSNDNDFFKMMMMSQMFSNGSNPFVAMLNSFNVVPIETPSLADDSMDA